ncbi:MAG: hypothetical protein FJ297_17810 [Planctomycetes bacterium]|nr:hypothetical protein [Planctomycetota bacterium]
MDAIDAERRPIAFLIGYCGALMLVDAARFLRELAEDRPHLKEKLNEPAPEFGIPSGVYDRVQESLLSARHAWHLYHAFRYDETHRDELRRAASDQRVEDLFDRSLENSEACSSPIGISGGTTCPNCRRGSSMPATAARTGRHPHRA